MSTVLLKGCTAFWRTTTTALLVLFAATSQAQYAAPSQVTPANAANGISTSANISWSQIAGPNRYWLTVSTNSADLPTNINATSCPGCLSSGGISFNTPSGSSTSHMAGQTAGGTGTTRALSPGTTYYWRVQGWNTNGTQGNYSAIRSFTTAPVANPPGSFTVTGTPGCTSNNPSVQLNWSNASGANSYEVFRDNVSLFSNLTGTTFNNTTSNAGSSYTYFIRASNAGGVTNSPSISVTLPSNPCGLPAPATSQPASGAGSVSVNPTLSWSNSAGANRYWILISTSSNGFPAALSATTCPGCVMAGYTAQTSHTLPTAWPNGGLPATTSLQPGTTYFWRVQGLDNSVSPIRVSDYSPVASFTTATAANPPGSFTVTGTPGCTSNNPSVQLNWSTASGANAYEVFRDNVSLFSNLTGTTFNNTTPNAGSSYTYFIRASNAGGVTNSPSISVTLSSNPCGLPAPAISQPANGAGSVSVNPTLSWSNSAGANRYWILISTSSNDFPAALSATTCPGCVMAGYTAQTSHTLPTAWPNGGLPAATSLQPGTTYFWRVQGLDNSVSPIRVSDYSPVASFTTATVANPPASFTVTGTPGCTSNNPSVQLSWSTASGATAYEVFRDNVSLFSNLTSTTFNNTTPIAGSTYSYYIRASNAGGATNAPSINVTVPSNICQTTLPAPTLNVPSNTSTTPTLSWSNVVGANQYWLMLATTQAALPTSPTAINCASCYFNGNTTLTSHSIPSNFNGIGNGVSIALQPNTTYFWRVQGFVASGSTVTQQGSLSSVSQFTTTGMGNNGPGPFTLTVTPTCENSAPMNRLDWTAANNATGYQVTRDGSNLGGINNTQTFRNLSVTAGAQYSYVVRASNATGTSNSSAVLVTTLSNCSSSLLNPPDLTLPINAASNVGVTPSFTWQPVPTANRYWLTVATSATLLPNNTSASTCPGCVVSGNTTVANHTLNTGFPAGGRDPALALGTTYSWQVQAYTISGSVVTQQGNFSAIRTFSTSAAPPTPATPINLTPGDATVAGAVQPSRIVNLAWQPGPGSTPSNYRVFIREQSAATAQSFPVNGTGYEHIGASDKAYVWNVQACNAAGCSTPAAERFYRTPVAAALPIPGVPQPTSQSTSLPGATTANNMPIFTWGTVGGASHYRVTIQLQSGTATTYTRIQVGTNQFQPGPLTSGSAYQWAVEACNQNDQCSQPSNPLRYFVAGQSQGALPAPTSASPGSSDPLVFTPVSSLVQFNWTNSVQVPAKVTITEISCGTSTVSFPGLSSTHEEQLKPNCRYKWSVEHCVDCTLSNPNKQTRYFKTDRLPAPEALSPGNVNSPGSARTTLFLAPIVFEWADTPGSPNYWIEIYGDGEPLANTSLDSSRYVLTIPSSVEYVSWSVRACGNQNLLSCGAMSDVLYFNRAPPIVAGILPINAQTIPGPTNPSQDQLILITHGYNDNVRDGWAGQMARAICRNLGVSSLPGFTAHVPNASYPAFTCRAGNWVVVAYDWSAFNQFQYFPWNAVSNAGSIGDKLQIPSEYKFVHFVAHSAGSNMIHRLTQRYRSKTVHATYLDAFCPNTDFCDYGEGADWAEQYYTRVGTKFTRFQLPWAFNFKLDYLNNSPVELSDLLEFGSNHGFPTMQYRASAAGSDASGYNIPGYSASHNLADFSSGSFNFGARLGAAWSNPGSSSQTSSSRLQAIKNHFGTGKTCELLRFGLSNACSLEGFNFQVGLSNTVSLITAGSTPVTICQSTFINGTYTAFSCPNNLASKLKSTTGAAPQAGFVAADVVAQTEADLLEFDFKFNTAGPAEALQVYVDNSLVYIERNINTTNWTSTDRIPIQTMVPGTHNVRVAVVSEGTAAEVQVRNIRFSNVTLVDDEIFASRFEDGETNTGSGASGTPDLAISEGEAYVNTLVAGQDQTIGFKVQNSGSNVSRSTYASVRWMADNSASTCSGQMISSVEVPNIENGSDQRLTLNLPVPAAPGRYFACITVDENRVAGQANYANDVTFAGPFDVVPVTPTGFTVGGTLSGLAAGQSVTINNATTGESLTRSTNGSFLFAQAQNSGSQYNATVAQQPSGQNCIVTGGSGTITGGSITSILVNCTSSATVFLYDDFTTSTLDASNWGANLYASQPNSTQWDGSTLCKQIGLGGVVRVPLKTVNGYSISTGLTFEWRGTVGATSLSSHFYTVSNAAGTERVHFGAEWTHLSPATAIWSQRSGSSVWSHAGAVNTYYTFKIEIDPSGTVRWFVDGVLHRTETNVFSAGSTVYWESPNNHDIGSVSNIDWVSIRRTSSP